MVTFIPMGFPCSTSCVLAADFCVSCADIWLTPWCWDQAQQNQKSSEGYKKRKEVSLGEISASDGIFCNGKELSPGTQQTVGKRQGPSFASFGCWTTGTGFTGTKISLYKVQLSGGHLSFQALCLRRWPFRGAL